MAVKIPLHPVHPERICWGCEKYCSADDLRCGNGTVRTMHPLELFGDDWDADPAPGSDASESVAATPTGSSSTAS
jgi:hypothetical protein